MSVLFLVVDARLEIESIDGSGTLFLATFSVFVCNESEGKLWSGEKVWEGLEGNEGEISVFKRK